MGLQRKLPRRGGALLLPLISPAAKLESSMKTWNSRSHELEWESLTTMEPEPSLDLQTSLI